MRERVTNSVFFSLVVGVVAVVAMFCQLYSKSHNKCMQFLFYAIWMPFRMLLSLLLLLHRNEEKKCDRTRFSAQLLVHLFPWRIIHTFTLCVVSGWVRLFVRFLFHHLHLHLHIWYMRVLTAHHCVSCFFLLVCLFICLYSNCHFPNKSWKQIRKNESAMQNVLSE